MADLMLISMSMDNLDQDSHNFGPSPTSHLPHLDFPSLKPPELSQLSPTELCRNCRNLISGEYFYLNCEMVCPPCAVRARTGQSSDSQVAYACALFFGIGGAIFGCLLYAGFTMTTHLTMGYIAIAVGWIVGKSMKYGSNGLGGGRYQFTSALLTYSSISVAAIPVNLYDAYCQSGPETNWAVLLNQIPVWGLASPFLGLRTDLLGVCIRLTIVSIGICIAWRITQPRPLSVAGPYGLMAP
jgi:hypothetical protein